MFSSDTVLHRVGVGGKGDVGGRMLMVVKWHIITIVEREGGPPHYFY